MDGCSKKTLQCFDKIKYNFKSTVVERALDEKYRYIMKAPLVKGTFCPRKDPGEYYELTNSHNDSDNNAQDI